jgi:hypothetical protein
MEVDEEAFEFDGIHLNVSTRARAGVWRSNRASPPSRARAHTHAWLRSPFRALARPAWPVAWLLPSPPAAERLPSHPNCSD